MLRRLWFLFSIYSSSAHAGTMEPARAEIEFRACGTSTCATISYVNRTKENVCVSNGALPFDGEVYERALVIREISNGRQVGYRLIEPSVVSSSKLAVLVRLVPPGGTLQSDFVLSDFYSVLPDRDYMVEFSTRAYPCNSYDTDEYMVIAAQAKISR